MIRILVVAIAAMAVVAASDASAGPVAGAAGGAAAGAVVAGPPGLVIGGVAGAVLGSHHHRPARKVSRVHRATHPGKTTTTTTVHTDAH